MPGFIVKAAASLPIPIPSVRKVLLIATRMLQYADESLQRHYRIVESEGEAAKPTLFSKLYKAGDDGLPFKDVRDNAVVYIIAGSDTTVRPMHSLYAQKQNTTRHGFAKSCY